MRTKVPLLSFGLIILLLQCLLFSSAMGQEIRYEGFLGDQKVGELVVIREVNDENTKIIVEAQVETDPLAKTLLTYYSESMYVNQGLMQASSFTKVDGQIESDVQIINLGNSYEVEINGKVKSLDEPSLIGTDIFYFEEPKNISSILMLSTGEMIAMKKSTDHVYQLEHQGQKEYYKYSNGILQEVEISYDAYSLTFRLRR